MKALVILFALAATAAAQAPAPSHDVVLTAPAEPVELIVIKKDGKIEWKADKDKVVRALFNEIAIRDQRIQELTVRLAQEQADAAPFKAQIEARKAAEAKKAAQAAAAKTQKKEAPKAKP